MRVPVFCVRQFARVGVEYKSTSANCNLHLALLTCDIYTASEVMSVCASVQSLLLDCNIPTYSRQNQCPYE